MGTNANLSFKTAFKDCQTIYENYDGYPEGVAAKLAAFLDSGSKGFAERYIRANKHAELAGSMTPGAQYNYCLTQTREGTAITAFRDHGKPSFFDGRLTDFLNRYTGDTWITVKGSTVKEIRKDEAPGWIAKEILGEAESWMGRGFPGNANAIIGDAQKAMASLEETGADFTPNERQYMDDLADAIHDLKARSRYAIQSA